MEARYLPVLLVIALLGATLALAAPAKGELTFSASLFNPDAGETVWQGTGEYLFPVGSYLVLGPSVSLFDLGPTDGGAAGVAGEVNLKGPGLFFGAAAHKPTGDAADAVDYTYEARAGLKLGSGRWFAKLTASQVWSKGADGATTDPDGTSFQAGIGARF